MGSRQGAHNAGNLLWHTFDAAADGIDGEGLDRELMASRICANQQVALDACEGACEQGGGVCDRLMVVATMSLSVVSN